MQHRSIPVLERQHSELRHCWDISATRFCQTSTARSVVPMLSAAVQSLRLDVNSKTSVLRSITTVGKGCAARSSRWFCPRPRRRASGGSLAKRRHGCCGPPGTTVRYRRASRRADARGNISRGLFCLRFTLARALVPSAERHCNLPSVAVGSTLRAACSIAGPRASARQKSESRQVPLPPELHGHLRRWKRRGQRFAVEWLGEPVSSIKKAFRAVAEDAGLGPDVTPHVLRHTAATWLMQAGTDPWEAAGFLGMTVETLMSRYGHHHPDYLSGARGAFSRHRYRHRNTATEREQTSPNVTKIAEFSVGGR